MTAELPMEAQAERDALVAAIHKEFGGVTRASGMSWSECVVADNYGSEDERRKASLSDRDKSWSELVDDPLWQPFPGIGGFSFIDPIGFRYYLPPAMVRFLKGEVTEWYPGHLMSVIDRYVGEGDRLLTRPQLGCIARFISFMARHDPTYDPRFDANEWAAALGRRWNTYLNA